MTNAFATYPSLAGKTVFVTGGASGIGTEIVRGFSAQDAKVGFIDLDRPASAALAGELEAMSARTDRACPHCAHGSVSCLR